MFGDYLAIQENAFSLDIPSVIMEDMSEHRKMLERVECGLLSCLLSLKKRPFIRFPAKSKVVGEIGKHLALTIDRLHQEDQLFDFGRNHVPPLLLLLDRRDDPVTPLLMQWTYQAMVHELLGIKNNRVAIEKKQTSEKQVSEILLSPEQDEFYKKNMTQNFGELGVSVKQLVDEFAMRTKSNENIQSLEQIKQFISKYPEFKQLSGNVSKHVSLISDLSKIVASKKLMEVSEIQQELACHNSHASAFEKVMQAIQDPSVADEEKVKLVMLYHLRYETSSSNSTSQLISELIKREVPRELTSLVTLLTKFGGSQIRSGDLFDSKNVFKVLSKSVFRGIQGVENIYTQVRRNCSFKLFF